MWVSFYFLMVFSFSLSPSEFPLTFCLHERAFSSSHVLKSFIFYCVGCCCRYCSGTFKIAETKTKILHAFILLFPCRNIWNVCQALYEATDKGRKQWAPQSLHTGVCLFIEFIKCLISLEKLFKESGMINSHYSNKCPLDTR